MRVAGRAGRAGFGQWSGPLRRLGRRVRRVAAGTGMLALALPLAWPSGAGGQHLDLPSAASVRSGSGAAGRLGDRRQLAGADGARAAVGDRGGRQAPGAGVADPGPVSTSPGMRRARARGSCPSGPRTGRRCRRPGRSRPGAPVRGSTRPRARSVQSGTTAQSEFYKNAGRVLHPQGVVRAGELPDVGRDVGADRRRPWSRGPAAGGRRRRTRWR